MKIIEIKKEIDTSKCDWPGCESEETRYAIADDNGNIVDDAQGYGYKTSKSAAKAMWWKFKDGKKKASKQAAWWRQHKDLFAEIQKFLEINFKEIMRGELTQADVDEQLKAIAKDQFKIELADEMLSFLHRKGSEKMIFRHRQK